MMAFGNLKHLLALVLLPCAVLMATTPASAGLIDTGTPFDDGVNPPWAGITHFDLGEIVGDVHWVVYGPGDFPFENYTPPPDELTYVYQIFNTNASATPDFLSALGVRLENEAYNIASFSDSANGVEGVSTFAEGITASEETGWIGYALWDFVGAGIAANENSKGLVFSSPNVPQDLEAHVYDGGTGPAHVVPVPSPSSEEIPEPSTWVLLVVGLVALWFTGFWRRGVH